MDTSELLHSKEIAYKLIDPLIEAVVYSVYVTKIDIFCSQDEKKTIEINSMLDLVRRSQKPYHQLVVYDVGKIVFCQSLSRDIKVEFTGGHSASKYISILCPAIAHAPTQRMKDTVNNRLAILTIRIQSVDEATKLHEVLTLTPKVELTLQSKAKQPKQAVVSKRENILVKAPKPPKVKAEKKMKPVRGSEFEQFITETHTQQTSSGDSLIDVETFSTLAQPFETTMQLLHCNIQDLKEIVDKAGPSPFSREMYGLIKNATDSMTAIVSSYNIQASSLSQSQITEVFYKPLTAKQKSRARSAALLATKQTASQSQPQPQPQPQPTQSNLAVKTLQKAKASKPASSKSLAGNGNGNGNGTASYASSVSNPSISAQSDAKATSSKSIDAQKASLEYEQRKESQRRELQRLLELENLSKQTDVEITNSLAPVPALQEQLASFHFHAPPTSINTNMSLHQAPTSHPYSHPSMAQHQHQHQQYAYHHHQQSNVSLNHHLGSFSSVLGQSYIDPANFNLEKYQMLGQRPQHPQHPQYPVEAVNPPVTSLAPNREFAFEQLFTEPAVTVGGNVTTSTPSASASVQVSTPSPHDPIQTAEAVEYVEDQEGEEGEEQYYYVEEYEDEDGEYTQVYYVEEDEDIYEYGDENDEQTLQETHDEPHEEEEEEEEEEEVEDAEDAKKREIQHIMLLQQNAQYLERATEDQDHDDDNVDDGDGDGDGDEAVVRENEVDDDGVNGDHNRHNDDVNGDQKSAQKRAHKRALKRAHNRDNDYDDADDDFDIKDLDQQQQEDNDDDFEFDSNENAMLSKELKELDNLFDDVDDQIDDIMNQYRSRTVYNKHIAAVANMMNEEQNDSREKSQTQAEKDREMEMFYTEQSYDSVDIDDLFGHF